MPRTKTFNFVKLHDELVAADAAIDPILVAANITTLKVDGKDKPAFEVLDLPIKIAALGALISTGDKTQDTAQLIAANGQLAAQAEQAESKLTTANATVASQSQKITSLEGQLAIANASIERLTASGAQNELLLKASNLEVGRVTKDLATANTEVSRMALDFGCLDLADDAGKPLAKDAADDEKMSAAIRIPISDKIKASKGAVNAAAARVGVQLPSIPSSGAAAPANAGKKLTIDEEIRQAKAAQARK